MYGGIANCQLEWNPMQLACFVFPRGGVSRCVRETKVRRYCTKYLIEFKHNNGRITHRGNHWRVLFNHTSCLHAGKISTLPQAEFISYLDMRRPGQATFWSCVWSLPPSPRYIHMHAYFVCPGLPSNQVQLVRVAVNCRDRLDTSEVVHV